MTTRTTWAILAIVASAGAAHAGLSAGSIAYTLFNGDNNDDFSFVALEAIAPNTTIYFRDDEFDGVSAFNDSNEMTLAWTSPAGGISQGEIVLISDLSDDIRAANVGTLTTPGSNNFGINNSNEVLYAYLSTGDFNSGTFTFLTAITNGASFDTNGTLTGTGLADGTTAFRVAPASTDVGAYIGSRSDQLSFGAYLPQVYNIANWSVAAGSDDQSGPFRPFSTEAFTIPAPGALALMALGLAVGGRRRR